MRELTMMECSVVGGGMVGGGYGPNGIPLFEVGATGMGDDYHYTGSDMRDFDVNCVVNISMEGVLASLGCLATCIPEATTGNYSNCVDSCLGDASQKMDESIYKCLLPG
jgi:hypothetical protein